MLDSQREGARRSGPAGGLVIMARNIRAERRALLERGLLRCDCHRRASHLDSHGEPECDHCRQLNAKVVEWHHATRQSIMALLEQSV